MVSEEMMFEAAVAGIKCSVMMPFPLFYYLKKHKVNESIQVVGNFLTRSLQPRS